MMLTIHEKESVYLAAILGEDDPIGTEESEALYQEMLEEIAAMPDGQSAEIPAEIPDELDDPYENEKAGTRTQESLARHWSEYP